MENNKKTGFIAPIITSDHHVLGSNGIPLPIIKVDGDWTSYLPTFESQLENTFDSDGCTVYGTLNGIETLEKYVYGTESNHSDRFTYNAVGISPPGSDPHLVATTIRGTGLVDETDLPDACTSLAEFMTPRPLTIDLRIKGQKWLQKKQLGHQWLWDTQPDQKTRIALITEALTKGVVCISVTAWYKNDQGFYYSPDGLPNEHWTHVYKVDETGIYVFDSYITDGAFLKKVTLDHNIQFAKVYFFTVPTQQQNWLSQLISSLLQLVGLKQKQVAISVGAMPPYSWDTPQNSEHSVRVICDQQGLNPAWKDIIQACVHQESLFNNNAVNHNKNSQGVTTSTDWGICQINDRYHIGTHLDFPSVDYVVNNPDKAVIFMINMSKAGKLNLWVSYSSGAYKKYLKLTT